MFEKKYINEVIDIKVPNFQNFLTIFKNQSGLL